MESTRWRGAWVESGFSVCTYVPVTTWLIVLVGRNNKAIHMKISGHLSFSFHNAELLGRPRVAPVDPALDFVHVSFIVSSFWH